MPAVLDGYWSLCVAESRIAPPLQLRYNVPAADTAAVFTLVVGWHDASNVYGRLLHDPDGIYQQLYEVQELCSTHRWRHALMPYIMERFPRVLT